MLNKMNTLPRTDNFNFISCICYETIINRPAGRSPPTRAPPNKAPSKAAASVTTTNKGCGSPPGLGVPTENGKEVGMGEGSGASESKESTKTESPSQGKFVYTSSMQSSQLFAILITML